MSQLTLTLDIQPLTRSRRCTRPPSKYHGFMISRYGTMVGHLCRSCARLTRKYIDVRQVLKCTHPFTVNTDSAATDWRASWQACGEWRTHNPGTNELK